MGAANFYNKNAHNVYAVCMHSDECNLEFCNCGAEDDYMNLPHEVRSLWKGCNKMDNSDWERNYPGKIIAYKTDSQTFAGVCIDVCINAIIRSGYYDGANLDWEISINIGNDQYDDDVDDIIDYIYYFMDNRNMGMAKIQAKNAQLFIDSAKSELINELEDVYQKISTPLRVSASFSNGETWYTKAE